MICSKDSLRPIKYHEERIAIQNDYRHCLTRYMKEDFDDEDMPAIWFLTFLFATKHFDYYIRDIIVYDKKIKKLTRKIRIRANFIDKNTLVFYFTKPTNFLYSVLGVRAIHRVGPFLRKFGLCNYFFAEDFLFMGDEIIGRIDYVIDDYSANAGLLKYFINKKKPEIDFLRTANSAMAAMIISNRREFFPSEEERAPAPSA